jgi:hypothetical protein
MDRFRVLKAVIKKRVSACFDKRVVFIRGSGLACIRFDMCLRVLQSGKSKVIASRKVIAAVRLTANLRQADYMVLGGSDFLIFGIFYMPRSSDCNEGLPQSLLRR